MERTERCELVSGVCRLTGGVEGLEGSGACGAQNRGGNGAVATVAL